MLTFEYQFVPSISRNAHDPQVTGFRSIMLRVRTISIYAAFHHIIHLSRIGLYISIEGKIEQCLLQA